MYNESDWCNRHNGPQIINKKQWDKRPNRVRCPNCGRLLTPRTIDVEPFGPWIGSETIGEPAFVIPPHKKPYKKRLNRKRKRKTRHERSRL